MSHANTITMELIIKNCLINEVEADVVVAPTSSQGFMSQGPGALLKREGGVEIEKAILKIAPIAIGAAAVTTAGSLEQFSKVIHVPNRTRDRELAKIEHIRQSIRAALVATHKKNFSSVAIPGPGPCGNHISPKEIARAIVDEIRNFKDAPNLIITICDPDKNIVDNVSFFAFPPK